MTATTSTVAITGHRPNSLPRGAQQRIRASIRDLVGRFPGATWLSGGAIGVDQIAADELFSLGQRVELILPFPPEVQAALWSPVERMVFGQQVRQASSVEVLCTRANLVVAYWNGCPSGTAATVYEAIRQRVPVHWVPMTS